MSPTSRETVLGLYAYTEISPSSAIFRKFFDLADEVFRKLNSSPTYISISGMGYTGKFVKVGSRQFRKMLDSNFENIDTVSIVANPIDSDAPAYDRFLKVSFSFTPQINLLTFLLAANEALVAIESDNLLFFLGEFIELAKWDFGCAFTDECSRKPEFHLLELDPGNLSDEESRALNSWYASPPEERLQKLRDIYPWNILNQRQLNLQIGSITLKEYIGNCESSSLKSLAGGTICLWQIHDGKTREKIKKELLSAGVFV